jgi:hypothetical protein
MPNIDEWNRQADQLNWLAQHGMGGLGPLVNELPQWARGRAGALPGVASAPGMGGAGTLQGAGPLPGTYNPASGGIPGTTGTGASLANLLASISGQVNNLGPIIGGITGAENQALRNQYPSQYFGALDTVLGNVGRRATGDITDLLPQLQQGAAEYGVGAGISGSPNANSKLLRDLGLTSYGVQRQALQDLNTVQSEIPRVAPYSPNRLIPDIGQQLNLQALADMLRAAPVPEAAYQRTRADALAGLNRGFNAGGGGAGWFNQNPMLPAGAGTPINRSPSPLFAPPAETPRPGTWPDIFGGVAGIPQPPVGGPGFFETIENVWDTPFDVPGEMDIEQEFYDF